ncbi:MAG: sugar phosphate isomerase/epimerase [Firmicutes bacterium]|nr:sugar phosphate isomerase/epimerase [Bacillota bacterium]
MAFCLGSRIVSDRPLSAYLQETVHYFKAIELHTDPQCLSPYFAFTIPEKQTIKIYQERFKFRLTMHAPFINLRLGALDREERMVSINIFLNTMRLAADLGVQLITFHPCTLEPNAPNLYSETLLYEEGSIGMLLREAKKLGVILLMENMPRDPLYHPGTCDGSRFQELLWLFQEPEFGLTVDIGHALQAGIAPEAFLKMDRVRHFHLHENDRSTDLHQSIANNQDWWKKLIKSISKKFPDAIGVLEMKRLNEQIESLNLLSGRPAKRSKLLNRHEPIIPPIIGTDI